MQIVKDKENLILFQVWLFKQERFFRLLGCVVLCLYEKNCECVSLFQLNWLSRLQ